MFIAILHVRTACTDCILYITCEYSGMRKKNFTSPGMLGNAHVVGNVIYISPK